jgi:mxaA protein
MSMRRLGFGSLLWLVAALAVRAADTPAGPSAEVVEPRAFGYSVGAVLQRRVQLQIPAGLALDLSALPQARRPGQALELRAARLVGSELRLDYQVFLAPTEVRTLEMPPLQLRFSGPAGERFLRIDAWPVTVAPLVPIDVSPREGLGEMRPDTAPLPIDTSARQGRLLVYAAGLALLLAYLAHVYVGLPWWGRRRRPFAQAWRELRSLPARPTQAQRRAALQQLHQALNRSAGEVVFEAGLADFVAAHPRFAPLRHDLERFFQHSHEEFFAGRGGEADVAWLRALGCACRDAERGSA